MKTPSINLNRSLGWNLERHSMNITHIIEDGCDCYPWTETFVLWPRRSVSGKSLFWTKAFKRRVWVVWGTGFHMEPVVQYATAFDLLTYDGTSI
jgi:hypothetical protein